VLPIHHRRGACRSGGAGLKGVSPLALFVYNRPDHARKTIDALAQNELAKETELYIFSDAPKNEGAADKVDAVRALVRPMTGGSAFKKVHVIEAPKNKGLADSIISGVTRAMEEHGRCIVLEDDLVTAPDFLVFMNACLERYEREPVIGQATAYTVPIQIPADYDHSVYLMPRTCSLGWCTWADRWARADWEVKDLEEFKRDRIARRAFDKCGADRYDRLRRQVERGANSWSIRFGYSQFRQGFQTVYPTVCRLMNIGADGSGVHLNDTRLVGSISDKPTPFTLDLPAPDDRIIRQVAARYAGGLSTQIARMLRNNGFDRLEAALRKLAPR